MTVGSFLHAGSFMGLESHYGQQCPIWAIDRTAQKTPRAIIVAAARELGATPTVEARRPSRSHLPDDRLSGTSRTSVS